MSEKFENYRLPQLSETLSNLDTFGGVVIGSLYYIIFAVVIIYFANKAVKKFLFPRLVQKRYALVLLLTLYALIMVATSLLVLNHMGFDITVLARVAILVVIAFSALIFAVAPHLPSLPFKIGDMVEIDGKEGSIDGMTPMFTRVRAFNGRMIFIPTATVWTRTFTNYHFTPTRRIELALSINPDHDFADARQILMDIMQGDSRVLGEPAPLVRINGASAEGIETVGLCWVQNADFLTTRSDLYEAVIKATQANEGISLALERRQVFVSGELSSR